MKKCYVYPRIKDLRYDKDYTQAKVAEMLGLHLTQYRRYETGETEVPVHILIELAKIYNTTIDFIAEEQEIKEL